MRNLSLIKNESTNRKVHERLRNGQSYTIYNCDFRAVDYPQGLTISDVPYNQRYGYASYRDNLKMQEYLALLSAIPKPCVVVHYPEETINLLPKVWGHCDEAVSWVYNSNTGKQHRTLSWWGCKPDFRKYGQPYKNPNDPRVLKLIEAGRQARLYDWWEIQQVKNVSKEKFQGKVVHPCQTPEEVVRRIIATTAQPGQTIIDPFLGSGTVGKVTLEMGYNFIGFEIDPDYFQLAVDRIADAVGGKRVKQVAKAA